MIGLCLLADAQSSAAVTVRQTPRFVHYCSTMFSELLILCHFVWGGRRVQGEDVIRSAQVLVLLDPYRCCLFEFGLQSPWPGIWTNQVSVSVGGM